MRGEAAVGGGAITAGPAPPALLCFDLKPFLAALTVLTLLTAAWQLRPYHSLLIAPFSACPDLGAVKSTSLPSRLVTVHGKASNPNASSLPKQQERPATPKPDPNRQEFRAVSSSSSNASSLPKQQERPAAPKPDPNRREFRAVGSAAALFVQMGAYRGGSYTFAVVGLASKPTHVYGKPWFHCEWVPNKPANASASSPPIRAVNTYHMLPD